MAAKRKGDAMYEVYEPRVYEHANGGADADQEGRAIELDRFYVATSPEDDGGEIVAGPFDTPEEAERVIDEIASAAFKSAIIDAGDDWLPSLMSHRAVETINRQPEAFRELVRSFKRAHKVLARG